MNLLRKAYDTYQTDGFTTLFRKGLNFLTTFGTSEIRRWLFALPVIDDICYSRSQQRLRSMIASEETLDDTIETAYNFQGFGNYRTIRPLHAEENTKALVENVNELEPSVIVEIGAGYGGSFYLWSRAISSAECVISIDIDFISRHSSRGTTSNRRLLEAIESDTETHLIQGNSHNSDTFQRLQKLLDGRSIDLLYIDGDHRYEGVIQDFEMYSPLLRENGVVMMDDVDNTMTEVPEAWSEISSGRDSRTFKRTDKSSAQGLIRI